MTIPSGQKVAKVAAAENAAPLQSAGTPSREERRAKLTKACGFPKAFAMSTWRRPASVRSWRSSDKRACCCFRLAVSRGPLFSIQPEG